MKKFLALLLCLSMILTLMPAVFATETTPTEDVTTQAETTAETTAATESATEPATEPATTAATEETTVETTAETTEATTEATEETTEETTEATEEATEPTEGEFTGFAMLNGVKIEVGKKVWIKSGHKIYKTVEDTEGYSVSLPYKIEIKTIITDDNSNATWYEFDFADLSAIVGSMFLKDYKYVKAESVSTEKPVEGGQVEGSAGDVAVTVTGVPTGVTMTAETVVPRDIPTEVFEKIGNHKLAFSIDITLNNGETVWQPTEGGKVTVTLDVSKYGFGNGETIAILHEHEGTVKELGEYEVLDGKLTFETDGFSNFYGYTVDFEYDGTWYSIGGGSSIFLYTLFPMLGIDRDDKAISSITFSDDSLMVAENIVVSPYDGETAWQIRSLAPFQTEEVLTITFNDGSEPIEIKVYDALYETLSGTMSLNSGDKLGALNKPVTVSGNVTINLNGGTVTIGNKIYIGSGATLTIKGTGTLKWSDSDSYTGNLFEVAEGGKLVIEGNAKDAIIVDGSADWTHTAIANSTREKVTVTKQPTNTSNEGVTGSVFYVNNGTLALKNVKIQNAFSNKQASAIDIKETEKDKTINYVTLEAVTVYHCANIGSDASVLRLNACIAKLTNCTFTENFAVHQYCGVIKAGGPDQFCQLTMENCTATKNYSSGWGGVILWAAGSTRNSGADSSWAKIDGCTFTENKARYLGGAISNEAVMEITNTTIKNNIAMSGGGIASFPFTRTQDGDTGGRACGLTLGEGNVIEGNTAYASKPFTPFDKKDESADGDDFAFKSDSSGADARITYEPGGGGVWAYQNKSSDNPDKQWKFELEIGKGNTIQNNTANGNGGGVEIYKKQGDTTTLSITGATIQNNKAVNGGGIAVMSADVTVSDGTIKTNEAEKNGGGIYVENGEASVTGSGAVTSNTAKNGGGLYINSGSITANGGFITYNKATGSYTGSTTQDSPDGLEGVGGGIFLKKGTFTLSGENIGIYSNTASVAAADVYASGSNTTLTIPEVKNMNLSGMEGTQPTGWYADYMKNDDQYPQSVLGDGNPGRYSYYDYNKVEVKHTTLDNNKSTFYCLTLGLSYPGYGNLTITKKLDKPAAENQTFLFQIKGTTRVDSKTYEMTVSVVMEKGKKEATVTIANLPDGTYTITEGDWSWRYDEQSHSIYPKEKENETVSGSQFTLNVQNPEWVAVYTNAQTEDKWLSGETIAVNWWGDILKKADSN